MEIFVKRSGLYSFSLHGMHDIILSFINILKYIGISKVFSEIDQGGAMRVCVATY